MASTEPSFPFKPFVPEQSLLVGPIEPFFPVDPVDPVAPTDPDEPDDPFELSFPFEPFVPFVPSLPGGPGIFVVKLAATEIPALTAHDKFDASLNPAEILLAVLKPALVIALAVLKPAEIPDDKFDASLNLALTDEALAVLAESVEFVKEVVEKVAQDVTLPAQVVTAVVQIPAVSTTDASKVEQAVLDARDATWDALHNATFVLLRPTLLRPRWFVWQCIKQRLRYK